MLEYAREILLFSIIFIQILISLVNLIIYLSDEHESKGIGNLWKIDCVNYAILHEESDEYRLINFKDYVLWVIYKF